MADDNKNTNLNAVTQVAAQQLKSSLNKAKKTNAEEDSKEFQERNQQNQELQWQDSSNAKLCHKCQHKFTLTNRKHHCR